MTKYFALTLPLCAETNMGERRVAKLKTEIKTLRFLNLKENPGELKKLKRRLLSFQNVAFFQFHL